MGLQRFLIPVWVLACGIPLHGSSLAGEVQRPQGSDPHASTWSEQLDFQRLDDRWFVVNRWQGITAVVDPTGQEIRGPFPDADWSVRMQPIGLVRDGIPHEASSASLILAEEKRVRYDRGDHVVEYVHGADGLRQNFIVPERIAGKGALVMAIRPHTALEVSLVDDGTVAFIGVDRRERMRYSDLKVWDASGVTLPARMVLDRVGDGVQLSIVVDDDHAAYPITIDPIATTPNQLILGPGSSQFGFAVSTAGDLNRDGYSDLVVGAPLASFGQTNEGAVYVYYGTSTGIPAVANLILQIDQAGAQLGCSASTAGDVNGDGYADLIVGARTWESSAAELSEGAVFVYHGSATGIPIVPDLTLQPNHAGDNFGSNVACAGDINNDGYSDIIVGAYLAEYPTYQEGAAFIYAGSATGINPVPIHRLERNVSAAHFARSVASAGDVNGDGYSDVIIGAPDWTNVNPDAGAAFVWYGSASFLGAGTNPAPPLTLLGSTFPNGSYGWSVTCAGDLNGDGFSDVAVGAYIDENGQSQEGRVFVHHGAAAGLNTIPAIVLESNQVGAWMGRWVSTAGDMNGDGYADLIVGVELYDNGQSDEGAGYLYFGTATGIASSTPSMVFELNSAGANVGGCAGTAGDINGDGYSDLVLGARIYGSGGATAVFHGGPYSVNITTSRTWTGGVPGNQLGFSVANAGDVNGDGYADVLVGAPDATSGQAGEGLAYLFMGSSTGVGAAPVATLEANVAGARFGYSLGSAGDVNGDGYADVVVGAPLSGGTGATYVFMGGAGGLATTPAFTLPGSAGSRFGAAVAGAGDINGDGRSDILVGAPDISTAYLFLGSTAGLNTVAATILSIGPVGNMYGAALATAGDVNGDGLSDVIIGAPAHSNGQAAEGAVFVHHGANAGLVTPHAIMLEPNLAGAAFGCSVSGAGDINGNGYYDVIIGAELWESGQTDEGAAFVYYGTPGGITTAGAVTLQRNQANMRFGRSVAEAGDVNGDGYADVVIGAPLMDAGHTDEGQVLVYRGSAAGLVTTLPDLLEPNATNYQAGSAVSGGGDVDGDGYSDVLVGAPSASPGAASEGVAYWYRGGLARGLSRYTRQYDADLVTPMSTNSQDFANQLFFGIGHRSRNPISRMQGKLRWEVVFEGNGFSGSPITNSVLSTSAGATWTDLGTAGVELKELVMKSPFRRRYKWRVREEYPTHKLIDGQRFSRWFYGYATGLGDIGILPVELLDFSGEAVGDVNELHWTTATESNSDRFEIQRLDNGAFVPIGEVAAAGESSTVMHYALIDDAPPAGVAYYRLRIVDRDGAEQFSEVIAIARATSGSLIYPNPANDVLNVVLNTRGGVAQAVLVDATGRSVRMFSVSPELDRFTLPVSEMAPGLYTLQLLDDRGDALERLPVVKR